MSAVEKHRGLAEVVPELVAHLVVGLEDLAELVRRVALEVGDLLVDERLVPFEGCEPLAHAPEQLNGLPELLPSRAELGLRILVALFVALEHAEDVAGCPVVLVHPSPPPCWVAALSWPSSTRLP